MLRENRAAAVNTQIKAFKDFNKVALAIIPVVKSFDGKVYNRRFVDALNNAVLPEGCDMYFRAHTDYQFDIELRTRNRSYQYESEYTEYYTSTGYIDYDTFTIRTDFDKALTDKRINADAIIENIKREATKSIDQAGCLERGRDNYNAMIKELQAIADKLKAFNNEYDYTTRSVLGLNFEMRHCGSHNDDCVLT